ncbi:hypothetical protein GALMADRAFT_279274 [Galerina marginata CBS 339.88]|uniref:Uncharacterized protein n=1 Tax=Galerina marginata (strain CBS 339.88) TaxID=685588 RepID=A0A067T3E5_GALM3|nr:hypothetical protein GALMADRAFT_279274 [Galerina marginata CBS 339.88]
MHMPSSIVAPNWIGGHWTAGGTLNGTLLKSILRVWEGEEILDFAFILPIERIRRTVDRFVPDKSYREADKLNSHENLDRTLNQAESAGCDKDQAGQGNVPLILGWTCRTTVLGTSLCHKPAPPSDIRRCLKLKRDKLITAMNFARMRNDE